MRLNSGCALAWVLKELKRLELMIPWVAICDSIVLA